MTDVVDQKTRSRMMSAIGSKNTAPERFVQQKLIEHSISFDLHRKDLPGTPDLVLPLYKVAIFVNGCFWHQHEGCRYASIPERHRDFWQKKLAGTVRRDGRKRADLQALGWTVLVVWECGTRHQGHYFDEVIDAIEGELTLGEWPLGDEQLESLIAIRST